MNEKQLAGEKAVDFIEDGMVLGLGSGSTVQYTIIKIGEMVQKGLKIKCVSTSKSTTGQAKACGTPLVSINDVRGIDLTIDGADQVDPQMNGIKGSNSSTRSWWLTRMLDMNRNSLLI